MQPLLIRREEFQRLRALRAQSSLSSPCACCSASDLRECSVQKALGLLRVLCVHLIFHMLKNKRNGDEKSQVVLYVSNLEPHASTKCHLQPSGHSLSSSSCLHIAGKLFPQADYENRSVHWGCWNGCSYLLCFTSAGGLTWALWVPWG